MNTAATIKRDTSIKPGIAPLNLALRLPNVGRTEAGGRNALNQGNDGAAARLRQYVSARTCAGRERSLGQLMGLDRDHEIDLYRHHDRAGYWAEEVRLENPEFHMIERASPGPTQKHTDSETHI